MHSNVAVKAEYDFSRGKRGAVLPTLGKARIATDPNWSERPRAGIVGSSDKDDRDFAVILSSTALTDGVLTLRPLQRDDRDPMYAAVMESIAEVSRWLPWCHPGYSIGETEAFIESCITAWAHQTHFPFAIFDASTGQYLGGTGVNHIDRQNRQGSVGYWVRTGATRRGIAPRAVRILARFAFDTLQLSRLEIFARPENWPSRRVAEKSGAKFEAMVRNRVVQHGQAYDAALYSLIPADLVTTTAPGPG